MKKKCVGVFGGTFDPIHYGHLTVADRFLNHAVDEFWFMPCGVHPGKKGILSVEHRVTMLSLALAEQHDSRLVLCNYESSRQEKSYTLDTMRALSQLNPETHFVLIYGYDVAKNIPGWKGGDELLKSQHMFLYFKHDQGFFTEEFKRFQNMYPAIITCSSLNLPNISSTLIRNTIKSGASNASLETMLPKSVINYIFEQKLYSV